MRKQGKHVLGLCPVVRFHMRDISPAMVRSCSIFALLPWSDPILEHCQNMPKQFVSGKEG
jgi:hypothetical protein